MDIERRGLIVLHGDADDGEDGDRESNPDVSSMSLDGLAMFIKGRLSNSDQAQQRAILQAHKSAVDLFWAGCALAKARELCEAISHGEWTKFKTEHCLADSTANDAIRLFKSAKTPDALVGMGITEAKKKFVYPLKDASGQDKQPKERPEKVSKVAVPNSRSTARKETVSKNSDSEEQDFEADEIPKVIDPAEAVAEMLEEVAQKLNEIAQNGVGKVDSVGTRSNRFLKALDAVYHSVQDIYGRINNDLHNS